MKYIITEWKYWLLYLLMKSHGFLMFFRVLLLWLHNAIYTEFLWRLVWFLKKLLIKSLWHVAIIWDNITTYSLISDLKRLSILTDYYILITFIDTHFEINQQLYSRTTTTNNSTATTTTTTAAAISTTATVHSFKTDRIFITAPAQPQEGGRGENE